MFADGLRHLEHVQSGFPKTGFSFSSAMISRRFFGVLQFVLFDVGPHFFRDLWLGYGSG
jgi:hypothetical protein